MSINISMHIETGRKITLENITLDTDLWLFISPKIHLLLYWSPNQKAR